MISEFKLRELSNKHQTTELNIRREYFQHLFLSYFYRQPNSNNICFKGGTALRVVFSSPRFSEDLDFSATEFDLNKIEDTIITTLKEIEREGIATNIIEAKATSGGYLAQINFSYSTFQIPLLLQFSKRKPKDKGEVITIAGDFIPAYTLVMLERQLLIAEKILALLDRSKSRDFYDLYFLIRANLLPVKDKAQLIKAKEKVISSDINFDQELKQFLPKTHWPVIRDFKIHLLHEIERFVVD